MGNSLDSILIQWNCFDEFLQSLIDDKKENGFTKKQVENLISIREYFNHNDFKFFFLILKFIVDELNSMNKTFQNQKCQLHLLFPLSRKLINTFIDLIYKPNVKLLIESPLQLKNNLASSKNFLEDDIFINNLKNYIDFEQNFIEFTVSIEKLNPETLSMSKKLISQITIQILKYLPINDKIAEAFQLLDPRKKFRVQTNFPLFRDQLLKKFIICYGFENYESVLKEYKEFIQTEDSELPINFEKYISKKTINFKVEKFWLERNIQEDWRFKLLSNFFINLMIIPHSNMHVESMFSHVKNIKTPMRNSLDVSTVTSLLKVKSYYLNNKNSSKDDDEVLEKKVLFEPELEHYRLYKLYIKDE